jgi:hypothetical protein
LPDGGNLADQRELGNGHQRDGDNHEPGERTQEGTEDTVDACERRLVDGPLEQHGHGVEQHHDGDKGHHPVRGPGPQRPDARASGKARDKARVLPREKATQDPPGNPYGTAHEAARKTPQDLQAQRAQDKGVDEVHG